MDDSNARVQWLPEKEDQVRRRHDELLALFGMYSPQTRLRSSNYRQ